jgi:acyl transferase domain-containing protein
LLAGKYVYTQIWPKNPLSAKDTQQLRESQQQLLQHLADLDERYESGQLDEPSYTRERTRRKKQLVELTALLYKNS